MIVSSAFGLRLWLEAARRLGLLDQLVAGLAEARLLARNPVTADGLRELGLTQIWSTAAILEPVRASFRDDRPLRWVRVHDLPDFVYFNHSIHVKKGVGCETCHGRVDQMPLTMQKNSLQMDWCLECHRAPEQFVRPRSEVFTMGYRPPVPQSVLGPKLVHEYGIQSLTTCSTCHR